MLAMNSSTETPEISVAGRDPLDEIFVDFHYADADSYESEMTELYSYTEYNEFDLNVEAFNQLMAEYHRPENWCQQDCVSQVNSLLQILERLELCDTASRLQAARCALYLVQGCWQEASSLEQQRQLARDNVLLLLQTDAFDAFIALLLMEIEAAEKRAKAAAQTATHSVHLNMEYCTMLRVVLSVLYTMTETLRHEQQLGSAYAAQAVADFVDKINAPLRNGELLTCTLLHMVWLFSTGKAVHFPVKKVLLFLWKLTLLGWGGSNELRDLKRDYRHKAGLPCFTEDTVSTVRRLPPSCIPVNHFSDPRHLFRNFNTNTNDGEGSGSNQEQLAADTRIVVYIPPHLPWREKTCQRDVENYVHEVQKKFLGFSYFDGQQNIAGLPLPIKESVAALQRHVYVSLAEVQMRQEEQIASHPFSKRENEPEQTPVELFYAEVLPRLPEFIVALLKVLLATMPISKVKVEGIDLSAELRPKQIPASNPQSTVICLDIKRHNDIIVKAISAVLLLYLKHFKLSHVYQFEFLAQCLMYGNCLPLIIRIIGQNPQEYVCAKNTVPMFEFPNCVLGLRENVLDDNGETEKLFCWRNTFSCINLLRVMNKIVKGKYTRVMQLLFCKATPTLKKLLQLRNSILQLYVLKLLKMQTRLHGRAWRRNNIRLMSAIYTRVRHRLLDNWAFGCDSESPPVDHQASERSARALVERFHMRRYPRAYQSMRANMANSNFCYAQSGNEAPASANNEATAQRAAGSGMKSDFHHRLHNLVTQLSNEEDSTRGSLWDDEKVELTSHFKENYEEWLHNEVYNNQIDWDAL